MRKAIVVLFLVGCGVEPLPPCADIGCPVLPSGDPGTWTPCTGDVCWCWGTGTVEACTPESD